MCTQAHVPTHMQRHVHTYTRKQKKKKENVAIGSVPLYILVEYEGMRRDFLIIKKTELYHSKVWGVFVLL